MSLAQRFVQRFASPILILLLAVIIGLTVFYQKVESEQHFLYLDLINQLEKQDEHYRSTLLYRRFQMSENFDELVKVEREIKYLLSQLMIHSDYMGDEYSGRLYRQLDLLRVRFERKEREVSKFKSSRALYNNSILYLPTLSKQTEAYAKFEKSSLPYEAHRVMEDLLAYLMNDQRYSSLALLERFEALQREIESTRGEGGLAVQGAKEVLRHSSLVLNSYTKMEQHLKAALAVGVTAEIDQLRSIHQAGQEEEEERSGRVTQLLFLFVLLLFLGLVLAVGYLRRVHQTLQRSHERTTQVAEEYTTIVNATPSGVGIIDMEGKLVKANPALLEIFGYEAGELLNQPIERLVPERFHGQHQQFRKAFSNNPHTRAMGSGTSTVRGIRKSGVEFPLNIGLSPITLDGASYIMAGVVDTTEFTRLEKAKDEFLASMSHELRTPLATIIGNCEVLAEHAADSEDQEIIYAIGRAGRNQLALVNDILDMSKIEAGKFVIEETPYDLNVLLNDLERMFLVKACDQGIELTVEQRSDEPLQLLGDGQRVGQILINLLANAIKFTEQGGVLLKVWHDSRYLFCNVEDTGVGMSPDTIDKLFGRFEQADGSVSRRFGGSGLGLYISLNLTEMMGGEIDVSSIEGKGSIFQLRIPYRPTDIPVEESQADGQTQSILQQRYDATVLIAEDTLELQLLERRILESMGITVAVVENGVAAVERASANSFDLILMDMQMPEMDGIEATRVLREQGVTTPIVPLTANVMQRHRDAFAAEGCEEFLMKPIDRQELRRVLHRYLVEEKDQLKLAELGIEDRRIRERRSEEIAIIDDDRSTKKPRRLQDKFDHSVAPSRHSEAEAEAEDEVDDELMAIFFDSTTKNRDKLTAALSAKNWAEVRAVVHTVKGSAASFGYPELSMQAEAVQLSVDEGRAEEVAGLAMDLVIEMGRVLP